MAVCTVGLADSAGMVRLLNVVNSLERPVCQRVTRQWEALCAALPPNACIYTVSMDAPQMQAHCQDYMLFFCPKYYSPTVIRAPVATETN